jgi:hypothetical protein
MASVASTATEAVAHAPRRSREAVTRAEMELLADKRTAKAL